jgi:hypothetical protein
MSLEWSPLLSLPNSAATAGSFPEALGSNAFSAAAE